MSTTSVYKFKLNNNNKELAEDIIKKYLIKRNFHRDQDINTFRTPKITKYEQKENTKQSMLLTALNLSLNKAQAVVLNNVPKGFEYEIIDDILLIKAYIIDDKLNSKRYITSNFNATQEEAAYRGDLRGDLFKTFKKYDIKFISKEKRKINDGSEFKTFIKVTKMIFLYAIFCILVAGTGIFIVTR